MSPPLFEVVTPTASAALRRLTTAAKVRAMIGSPSGDDTKLESIIDRVSGDAATYCKLARGVAGDLITFGSEALRATWQKVRDPRGTKLILPWRTPVTLITSVVEDGVTLAAGTDYQLVGRSMIERLCNDAPIRWSCGKIVVLYSAGWTLPEGVPPELEGKVIEQVKTVYMGAERDHAVQSETINDVYAATYAAPGGTMGMGTSGLLMELEAALSPFKDWSAG